MTSNEEYRRCIVEIVNRVEDNGILKKIFTVAHHLFVRDPAAGSSGGGKRAKQNT